MREPILSVLLATRDGAGVLGRTLEAFVAAIPPSASWQMVAVDNGSRDATADILASFERRLPLEVIHHSDAGKNAALNAGVEACRGQLVVIVDDDVLPEARFLVEWAGYVDRMRDHSLFGGRIAPWFEKAPPAWVRADTQHHALMFSERDLPEGPVDPGDIYGCNMAVRREIFDRGFRFDAAIGPNRDDPNYRMGSEVEFLRRVGNAGERAWFARGPAVRHIVREHQWSEAAWVGRGYRCGRGRAYIMRKEGRPLTRPRITLRDRALALLPLDRFRLPALGAVALAQGFADESNAARS